jgi:serine protease Do
MVSAMKYLAQWVAVLVMMMSTFSVAGAQATEGATEVLPLPRTSKSLAAAVTASWGTGFVVSPGYLLTAYHVVQGQTAVLDLALLKGRVELPALSLASSADLPTGLEINVIGYPQPRVQGMGKKITHGIVNGYRSEKQNAQDIGLVQISAEVAKGNSGGPVIAPDGTVIGMVQRKLDANKVAAQTDDVLVNVNYALRSSQIIKFLQNSPAVPVVQSLSLSTVLRPYQIFQNAEASVLAVVGRKPTVVQPPLMDK